MGKIERQQTLLEENTNLGGLLTEIKDRPIGEYSLDLVTTPLNSDSQIQRSRELVMESMDSQLSGRMDRGKVGEVLEQYSASPLLQTGDHCQLIYDPQTFLNNFIYHMGASKLGLNFLLTQQCSTPRMVQYLNPLVGPGILKLPHSDYRLFDRSKRKLIRSNVATVGEVTYTIEPETPGLSAHIPQILEELRGSKFQTAVQAFLFTNNLIWNSIRIDQKQDLVLFDESLSSDVVASMIEDSHHPLHVLLFNPEARAVFRDEISRFISSPKCLMLKETTDFFWGKHKEALVALRLSEDETNLTSQIDKQGFELTFDARSVADALRRRDLYPSLFISMLATSVFPNNVVLGGASQYEYTPEVQLILKNTISRLGLLPEAESENITKASQSRMLGVVSFSHPICGEILKMDKGTDFSQWEAEIEKSIIDQALGDYSNFDYLSFHFDDRKRKMNKT